MLPTRLEISVGGYTGNSYHLTWVEGALLYSVMDYGYQDDLSHLIHPSDAQWEIFWKKLDKLKVWSWESKYQNLRILDGTHWSVEIEFEGKTIKSVGLNSYPGATSVYEMGKNYKQFLRAVRDLIGGLEFS